MRHTYLLIVTSLMLTASACKKSDKGDEIFFSSALTRQVHLNVYANADDYKTSTNPIYSVTLAPNVRQGWRVPDPGHQYYVDWFTDDYNISNWGIRNLRTGKYEHLMPVPGTDNDVIMAYTEFNNPWGRNSIIDGNKSQSTWKCVDVLDMAGNSIKPNLPDWQLAQKLIFRKDMKYEYVQKKDGESYNNQLSEYTVINRHINIQKLELQDNGKIVECYTVAHLPIESGGTYTRDTMLLKNDNGYIVFAKQ